MQNTGNKQSALLPLQQQLRLSLPIFGTMLCLNTTSAVHCRSTGIRQSALLVLQLHIRLLHVVQDNAVTSSKAHADVQLAKSCLTLQGHRDQAVTTACAAAAD